VRYTMNDRTLRRPESARGFTMLEVLISIVVIAFGLLGIAGLQAFALKNNQSAGQRMTTTMLANDMVERVWSSNRDFRPLYNAPSLASYQSPNSSCISPTGCSASQLVGNDLAEWQARLAASLPSGQGIICRDTSPDDGDNAAAPQCDDTANAPLVVKIWWVDDRSVTADLAKPLLRFTWSFNP
jgi:type IV pilus assembly protein PilV